MRRVPKRVLLFISVLALAALLVACGGGPSGTPLPDPGDDPGNGAPGDPGNGDDDPGEPGDDDPGEPGDDDPDLPDWATGVISGVFDGAPFTAYTYLFDDGAGGHDSTATWDDFRGFFPSVRLDLLATPTKDPLSFEHRIDLEMWLDGDFNPEPVDDPDDPPYSITYWVSGITDGYELHAGEMELEKLEHGDDDILRVKGTFSGTFVNIDGEEKELTDGVFDVLHVERVPGDPGAGI